MSQDNSGPAFPVAYDHQLFQPDTVAEAKRLAGGMTLRDYFAARALTMVGAGNSQEDLATWDYRHFAEYAYRMADAMLAERAK